MYLFFFFKFYPTEVKVWPTQPQVSYHKNATNLLINLPESFAQLAMKTIPTEQGKDNKCLPK